mgnify:CR=1 FL=1
MLSVLQYFVFFIMPITIPDEGIILIITPLPYIIKSNKLETLPP